MATAHARLEPARRRALGGLIDNVADPRELAVLVMRFGLDGQPKSLGRVGATLGLSRERIAQIERRALNRLEAGEPERKPSADAMRKRREAVARRRAGKIPNGP